MHKWQKDLWAALSGSDPREMKIFMGGRNIGKSVMAQMWTDVTALSDYYSILDKAIVDNENWYTVRCSPSISKWIKQQHNKMWHEHIDRNWKIYKNSFDIHEKIYTMLQLKYGDVRI